MDFLNGKVSKIYFKYLAAAFGSALITSIYSIVDMAMVGQYEGPEGTAALSVVAPVWNVIYSLGLLTGIGGSVIFSTKKGCSRESDGSENQYFTAAVLLSVLLGILAWAAIIFLERPILLFFGGNEELLVLAHRYLIPVKFVFPLFLFNQMLAAFLRNDQDPGLATAGVLAGGIFNIFGDYFFVFVLDMGVFGAGLATAAGAAISFLIMLSHFLGKRNTLIFIKVQEILSKWKEIGVTGFATFFVDAAMGILTILFNRQIMKYLGSDALAVYGPIINVSTFAQCCAYSVGQAAQPIISTNFGAGKTDRIKKTLHLALGTTAFFGFFWTALSLFCPNLYVRIFMTPTKEILRIAPAIIRCYAVSFILLPFNIFSTYYFQAVMRPKEAFIVSVLRGLILSGALILILPLCFGGDAIWLTMPVTEGIVAVYAGWCMNKDNKKNSCKNIDGMLV